MPKKEENVQPAPAENNNQPIINTDAAKAKAAEVAGNVKEGATKFVDKVKNDNALMAVCIAVVAIIAVLLLVFVSNTVFDGSKKAVKNFSSSLVKLNAKKFCKSINKEIIEQGFDDVDDCVDKMKEAWEDVDKDDKLKKYKIESKKKLSKDDVEEVAEELEDFDIDEKKVKKVVRYKVSFDGKGKDNDQDLYVYTAKIKGKWAVIGVSGSKDYSKSAASYLLLLAAAYGMDD